MSPVDPLLDRLRALVGNPHVLEDPDLRAGYETDWTGRFHGAARAVVRPADATEVAAVLAACAEDGVGVVPQGGNTGLVGGGVPRDGELVLSLTRLATVDVDATSGEVICGAGAVLETVQHAARTVGWDVGVDLASRGSCTVGGMVATNAGGEHVLRYGATVEQLIGVEAALSDGTIVGRVPALRKDNTGYRWAGILAGSEGTLGVITRVHLRLVPRLAARVTALVALDDLDAALELCAAARRTLPELSALEVCFAEGLALVCEHGGLPLPFEPLPPVVLLVECAADTGVDLLVDRVGRLLDSSGVVRATAVATDEESRARLWRYRDGHAEAVNALGVPHKLDVTLPRARITEFEREVRAAIAALAPGARTVLFGHLGDGNLHVNVLGPAAEDGTVDDAVLGLVVAMKGSISAEHGIGVAKREMLARIRSPGELAAMAGIKRALDPAGILNPGVLLSP